MRLGSESSWTEDVSVSVVEKWHYVVTEELECHSLHIPKFFIFYTINYYILLYFQNNDVNNEIIVVMSDVERLSMDSGSRQQS